MPNEVDPDDTLKLKISKLLSLPRKNGLLSIHDADIDDLAKQRPRNYSLIVLIGTEVKDCEGCRITREFLENIASGWEAKSPSPSDLYFASYDFYYDQALIKEFGIEKAPHMIHFPPTRYPSRADQVSDGNVLMSEERLVNWIRLRTGHAIVPYVRPDYTKVKVAGVVAIIIGLPLVFGFVTFRTMSAFVSLGVILSMLSGAMWISINSPPWVMSDGRKTHLYYPSRGAQLAFEAVIIFSLCILCGLGLLTGVFGVTSEGEGRGGY
ncbi:unnamed protein product [Dibothriocephalus latus]|uniref:Uncharacterized protein n=1 Tax=Dibothriocephalus latus TaxID=60516 RepID=A0A3P7NBV6_DIBLA|nr:unnamed protein product [Dibothriocephalus latus]